VLRDLPFTLPKSSAVWKKRISLATKGISSALLVSQVKNTAAWLWHEPRAEAATRVLDEVGEAGDGASSLRVMLVAHWATVGTFVPTDVDARIRHHAWTAIESVPELEAACALVDEIASWDPRLASARVLESSHGTVCGHDGEWLAVRSGALGRAIALDATTCAEQLASAIDAELAREERIFDEAVKSGAPADRVLRAATILAHNLGDLSRVVDQWPKHPGLVSLRDRYVRLGHPDAPVPRPVFVLAGALNKSLMALENHRFLALRKARALRTARDLLLPIGPWLDAWGETVARHPALEERDRAEVVTALLELHLSSPAQLGCLRALAGIHRATRGGLEVFAHHLPARIRKEPLRGRVREALDVDAERFAARIEHRCRAELVTCAPRGYSTRQP
jgi:hypothetical protein